MPAKPWRCGECGIVLPGDLDVEAHFQDHPVPIEAVLAPACVHAPLLVDVSPGRVYLWMSVGDLGDAALSVHPGWTPRQTPAIVREIVERENGSSLTTPGWYYPHTRPSAQALDALYHEIVRTSPASMQPMPSAAILPSPAPAMPWLNVRPALIDRNPKRKRRTVATVELVSGVVAGFVGANLMYLCTAYFSFDGCAERAYGFPGFLILLLGICLVLFGFGSLLSTLGRDFSELPSDWRPGGPRADPEVEAGAERIAAILWGAILMAGLVAAEAFPIYNLVIQTTSGQHPAFNLGAFLIDMVFFGVADVILVFLIVTYSSSS